VGLVVVAKDISELERFDAEKRVLEAHLKKARRLEALGALAGGVAHELNNILGGIVRYPDLLLHDMLSDDPFYRPLANIKQSGEKAAAIVEDLLAMARRGLRHTAPTDLKMMISDFLHSPEYLHLKSFHPKAEVLVKAGMDLWPTEISAVRMSKALMNLVSNALEALPDGGSIRIATQNKMLSEPLRAYETIPPGRYVALSLSDNGIGIASTDLEHIFEPFYSKKIMNCRP
jgi:two-component system cell cycle sensor histidine kinase/response regulator CckA